MLRINRETDYGILILTALVERSFSQSADSTEKAPAGRVLSAPEIAGITGLGIPTVSKVLKALVRGEILESRRGVQGGYRLAIDPEWITVQRIIEVLDGPISLTECADSGPHDCGVSSFCPLSSNWQFINERVRETLDGITLAQMAVPGGVMASMTSQVSDDSLEVTDV